MDRPVDRGRSRDDVHTRVQYSTFGDSGPSSISIRPGEIVPYGVSLRIDGTITNVANCQSINQLINFQAEQEPEQKERQERGDTSEYFVHSQLNSRPAVEPRGYMHLILQEYGIWYNGVVIGRVCACVYEYMEFSMVLWCYGVVVFLYSLYPIHSTAHVLSVPILKSLV